MRIPGAAGTWGDDGAGGGAAKLNDRLAGDLAPTHDPVIARENDTYYVFGTGHGQRLIETKTSGDLVTWTAGAPLFSEIPAWGKQAVPGTNGMWAPDLAWVNGRWRLYYSLSTFGSNRSAIGLFTSPTLDPQAPNYGWRDEGVVVQSVPSDNFNAIDPNFVIDREGRHWLSLGSFWTGDQAVRTRQDDGKPLDPRKPHALARRPALPVPPPR